MANNIVDIDPTRRLTKEVLDSIKESVSLMTVDNTEGLVVLCKRREGDITVEALGIDWALLGLSQAYLDDLRRRMLYDDANDNEELGD